jgi:hypothetical protein
MDPAFLQTLPPSSQPVAPIKLLTTQLGGLSLADKENRKVGTFALSRPLAPPQRVPKPADQTKVRVLPMFL